MASQPSPRCTNRRPGLLQRRQPVRHGRQGPAAARLRRGHEAAGDDAAGGRHEGAPGWMGGIMVII